MSAVTRDGEAIDGSMAAVNEAYRVLSDPARRAVYDRSLDAGGRAAYPGRAGGGEDGDTGGDHDGDESDDGRVASPARPTRLSPAGPARVPWRLMGATALIGSALVLVSSFFDEPPATEAPDGILRPGSCVAFEINGDAREVACSGAEDVVVEVMVPLDATCPASTAAHRDRLGMGIACVVER